jgi:hypothetical protein
MNLFHNRKSLWLIASTLALALGLLYAGLSIFKAISYTTTPHQDAFQQTPANLGLPYEEIRFPSQTGDNLTLQGWWLPNRQARKF